MTPMAQRPLDEPGVSVSSHFRPFIAETTLYPSIAAKESAMALVSARSSSGRGRNPLFWERQKRLHASALSGATVR
jgi:hypothetical protein